MSLMPKSVDKHSSREPKYNFRHEKYNTGLILLYISHTAKIHWMHESLIVYAFAYVGS